MTLFFFLLVVMSSVFCSSASDDDLRVRHIRSLMMDYNWPQLDGTVKKIPHEQNCHFYYQAEKDDIFTIRKCSKWQIFDYHKHQCTLKSKALCFSDRYGKTKLHDHIHSKIRKLFKCPETSGNFPDIFDCQRFFHCVDGIAKHRRCHNNKQFDKLRRDCIEEKNALCADITDVENIREDYKCPRPHGLFADPKVCSKYYKCLHRKPSLKICKNGYLYQEEKKSCVVKELVNCGSRYNPYDVTSLTETASSNEAESSRITFITPEETHSEKETTAIFQELSNTSTITSSSIPPSTPSEKSRTENIKTETATNDSTSEATSAIVTDQPQMATVERTESVMPNALPCLLETCIEEDGVQLRCSTADGLHPYNKDNSRFIQCENFKIRIQQCPQKQVFDVKQSDCVFSSSKATTVM